MINLRVPDTFKPLIEKPSGPKGSEPRASGSGKLARTAVSDKRSLTGLDAQQGTTACMDLPLGFEKPRFI